MNQIKLGLLVNPMAGIGGAVGLKGSDGESIVDQALQRGAVPRALQRVGIFLRELQPYQAQIQWFCWGGAMGEDSLQEAGFNMQVCGECAATTGAVDTRQAARALQQQGVDRSDCFCRW